MTTIGSIAAYLKEHPGAAGQHPNLLAAPVWPWWHAKRHTTKNKLRALRKRGKKLGGRNA